MKDIIVTYLRPVIAIGGIVGTIITSESIYIVACLLSAAIITLLDAFVDQEMLIIKQRDEIRDLKKQVKYSWYSRKSVHVRRILAVGDREPCGVISKVEVTIENLEDEKLPLTRTFKLSHN